MLFDFRTVHGARGNPAIYRVAADGISPAQAVDEALARIKQILAE